MDRKQVIVLRPAARESAPGSQDHFAREIHIGFTPILRSKNEQTGITESL